MRKVILSLLALLVPVVAAATGCAYTAKNSLPANIKTIQVETFGNSTYYNGLEATLTREIIQRVNLTPGLSVVNSGGDATLSGEIYEVRNITTEYDANGRPRTVQVAVSVRYNLYDNRSGEYLTSGKTLINTQNGSLAGRMRLDREQQTLNLAQDAALAELARVLVRDLNSGW